MIRVIATFIVEPSKIDEFTQLATEMVTITREEKGCAQYDLAQSVDEANRMVIIEGWQTQEDLDAHSAAEHFTRLVPQIGALCVEAPSIDANLQIV